MSVAVITVDGPSGVGKGTLSQWLSCQTGFELLDSGAIYRALAYGAMLDKLDLTDVDSLAKLAGELPVEFKATSIIYKGNDVTAKVRTEEVAAITSQIAAIPEVRAALLQRQKDFAQPPGLIADGRDMGTVVFPNADLKLFLTASAEIRAERRVKQLKNQGVAANIDQITQDIIARDERDANRSTAPTKAADDAVVIDTSNMNIDQVFEKVKSLLIQKNIGF